MSARILLVDDEPGVLLVVGDLLRTEGYDVETAADGIEGLELVEQGCFDLLVLDVAMPGASGFEICHSAREQGFDGGILMLTARAQVSEIIEGLRTGADDYLVKPFHPGELLARVGALLRRVQKRELTPVMAIRFGDVDVDFSLSSVTKSGRPVDLTPKELQLLRTLVDHRGRALSRGTILAHVWSDQPHITVRTVDVHVAWLRGRLEDDPHAPQHILTVRGEGYLFRR